MLAGERIMYSEVKRYKWYQEIALILWYPYLFVGFPITLFFCWLIIHSDHRAYGEYYRNEYNLAWICIIIAFVPIIIHFWTMHRRTAVLKRVVEYVKEETGFTLARGWRDEVFLRYHSTWVGIDNINGNLLYVKVFPNGVLDVIGLSPSNISAYGIESNKLITLHTNLPRYPFIKWSDFGKNERFYELITQFMNNHSGDNRFQSRIFSLREKLEDISGLIVPDISITTGSNMTHAEKVAQAHTNAQKLKAWQAEMQRKEDEERARERQQQNANHSAPAMDEPEYVELPRIPELSPEEQAALDKSTEKERAEMEKILGPIPTSFN
nr:hypothetical protein [Escherichia coli]